MIFGDQLSQDLPDQFSPDSRPGGPCRARAAGLTRSTNRRARVSEPTRPTRFTNPRQLANPSHQHKRLLSYCCCRYFLIFSLLTYCCPHLLLAAEKGAYRKQNLSENASVATVIFGLNGLA